MAPRLEFLQREEEGHVPERQSKFQKLAQQAHNQKSRHLMVQGFFDPFLRGLDNCLIMLLAFMHYFDAQMFGKKYFCRSPIISQGQNAGKFKFGYMEMFPSMSAVLTCSHYTKEFLREHPNAQVKDKRLEKMGKRFGASAVIEVTCFRMQHVKALRASINEWSTTNNIAFTYVAWEEAGLPTLQHQIADGHKDLVFPEDNSFPPVELAAITLRVVRTIMFLKKQEKDKRKRRMKKKKMEIRASHSRQCHR